jgi:hypothetical protein
MSYGEVIKSSPAELQIKGYPGPHQMYQLFAVRKLHTEIILMLYRLQCRVRVFLEADPDSLPMISKRSFHIIDWNGVRDGDNLDMCVAALASQSRHFESDGRRFELRKARS